MEPHIKAAIDKQQRDAGFKDYNKEDIKFAQQMIPHHLLAIDMAKEVLSKGANETIDGLAKNIISAQQKEINILRKFLSDRSEKEDSKMHM